MTVGVVDQASCSAQLDQASRPEQLDQASCPEQCHSEGQLPAKPCQSLSPCVRRHEPYLWDCVSPLRRAPVRSFVAPIVHFNDAAATNFSAFRYVVHLGHHTEYLLSPWALASGAFVVVDGDRGIDVGIAEPKGESEKTPVLRPAQAKQPWFRTCLGLAPLKMMTAKATAMRLGGEVLRDLRSTARYFALQQEFLGVEVQSDMQYAVVFYRSLGHGDLIRQNLVGRLYANYHMRFWFVAVDAPAHPRRAQFPWSLLAERDLPSTVADVEKGGLGPHSCDGVTDQTGQAV